MRTASSVADQERREAQAKLQIARDRAATLKRSTDFAEERLEVARQGIANQKFNIAADALNAVTQQATNIMTMIPVAQAEALRARDKGDEELANMHDRTVNEMLAQATRLQMSAQLYTDQINGGMAATDVPKAFAAVLDNAYARFLQNHADLLSSITTADPNASVRLWLAEHPAAPAALLFWRGVVNDMTTLTRLPRKRIEDEVDKQARLLWGGEDVVREFPVPVHTPAQSPEGLTPE